ncbi:peptidase M3A/M3B [Baffinella frigidus]|nr:peptidase M3A/M3B [Cryptophyta sp. CCMP2293]
MFAGLDTMQQVVYSALDLELHAELTNLGKAGWSRHVADEVLHRHSPLAHGAPGGEQGDWHAHFSHLGSYGANYYSYLSSRVLSAAIWARLFAQDPLKEGAGAALVDEFLTQ